MCNALLYGIHPDLKADQAQFVDNSIEMKKGVLEASHVSGVFERAGKWNALSAKRAREVLVLPASILPLRNPIRAEEAAKMMLASSATQRP